MPDELQSETEKTSRVTAILRERLPHFVIEPREVPSRFAATSWFAPNSGLTTGQLGARNWWGELPTTNRLLLACGGLCLLYLTGKMAGPPLYMAGQSAVFPYTAEGKRQSCLDNLRAIHQALDAYSQDYDGQLPVLDAQDRSGTRLTWVSLLQTRGTEARLFQCPTGPSVPQERATWTASYAINPALAGQSLTEADSPEQTLLLADGGERHDVSLLPPFPSWPSVTAHRDSTTFDARLANFGFRHGGGENQTVGAVYADGHAEPLTNGDWALSTTPWGGSAVIRRSLERLEKTNALAGGFIGALRKGDVAGATRILKTNRQAVQPTAQNLLTLCLLNQGEQTSDSVEALGWHLARALEGVGDGSARQQLNEAMSRRVAEEWQKAQNAGIQRWNTDSSYAIELPANWSKDEGQEGRYHRTFFRSGLPAVMALVEIGERSSYGETMPIAWEGTERELKGRYGAGYKRIRRDTGLLNANTASIWEYEIEKAGSPRLRKLAIGYVSGWQSYALVFTAPAKDWEKWKSLFNQATQSFGMSEHTE